MTPFYMTLLFWVAIHVYLFWGVILMWLLPIGAAAVISRVAWKATHTE